MQTLKEDAAERAAIAKAKARKSKVCLSHSLYQRGDALSAHSEDGANDWVAGARAREVRVRGLQCHNLGMSNSTKSCDVGTDTNH